MFRWMGLSLLVLVLCACGGGGSDSSSDSSPGAGGPSVPQTPERSTVDLSEPSVDPEGCFTTTPCLDDTDCQAGTRCNTAGAPPRCAEIFCGGSGALCSSDDFCEDGLACNPGYAPQECRAGVSGDICLYDADGEGSGGLGAPCAEGFVCIDYQHPPRCIDVSLLDPEQQILIDGQVAQDEPVEVELQYMPQSAQWVSVEVQNVGWVPLTIKAIDWSPDANPHVSLETDVGASCASGTELEPGESCSLTVTYAWPAGQTFDGSPSTLLIKTDAMGGTGTSTSIVFTPVQPAPAPQVNPPNFTFSNATPTKPEQQTFSISNDSDWGGGPFQVTGIALEQPSDTFVLTDLPTLPAAVEQGDMCGDLDQPGCSVKFTVKYAPISGEQSDSNAVLISTDATPEPLKVPLSSSLLVGGYEISFSHVMELDFTSSTGMETRSVALLSTGPGVLKVKEPSIEPWEATPVFSWQAFIPATTPDGNDSQVTSWPRALTAGKSLTFDVTYQPPGDGSEPPNGALRIPVETPDNKTIEFDLFAGTPKPKMSLAPATGSVSVTADKAAGATGSRNVVIYNDGNGDLTIKSAKLTNPFNAAAEVFSLAAPLAADTVVPPHSLLVLQLNWDASQIKQLDGDTEILTITYYDPYTGGDETKSMGLFAKDSEGMSLPVADPGSTEDYSGSVVGDSIYLDGSDSYPGEFSFFTDSHTWYLTDKPATSKAKLNTSGGGVAAFTPDAPGNYEVELVVFSKEGSDFLSSNAASVSFTVAPQ